MQDEYAPMRCYHTYGCKKCSLCGNEDKYAIFIRELHIKNVEKLHIYMDSCRGKNPPLYAPFIKYLCQECLDRFYDVLEESQPIQTDFIITKKLPIHRKSKRAYQ